MVTGSGVSALTRGGNPDRSTSEGASQGIVLLPQVHRVTP